MRVVVDSNVLISALLKADSGPARVVALWREGTIELVVSSAIVAEITRVLAYPRIQSRVSEEDATRFVTLLRAAATFVEPVEAVVAVERDPDDDKFVALALASDAKYIVSGDSHLLDLGEYQGIEIIGPAQLVDMMRSLASGEE